MHNPTDKYVGPTSCRAGRPEKITSKPLFSSRLTFFACWRHQAPRGTTRNIFVLTFFSHLYRKMCGSDLLSGRKTEKNTSKPLSSSRLTFFACWRHHAPRGTTRNLFVLTFFSHLYGKMCGSDLLSGRKTDKNTPKPSF